MKIGIISDTHNFFDPQIPALFAGVGHILHAGDIGLPKILLLLHEIAPVTAVLGNTDEAGFHYRETEVIELAARKFLLHHIVTPRALNDSLRARVSRERPDVLVFGHTHKPFAETVNGMLFLNPGYAGKSRFGLARSVAILHCEKAAIRAQFVPL